MCVDSLCPVSCLFVPTLLWQRVTENCFKLRVNPAAGSFEWAECVWGWFQPCIFSLSLLLPGSCSLQNKLFGIPPSFLKLFVVLRGWAGMIQPLIVTLWAGSEQNCKWREWRRFPAMKTGLWLCMFSSFPAGNHVIPFLLTYLVQQYCMFYCDFSLGTSQRNDYILPV